MPVQGRSLPLLARRARHVGKTPAYSRSPGLSSASLDFEVAEKMLNIFREDSPRPAMISRARPRVVIGVPLDVTEVERKAVGDAVMGAGARRSIWSRVRLLRRSVSAFRSWGRSAGHGRGSSVEERQGCRDFAWGVVTSSPYRRGR